MDFNIYKYKEFDSKLNHKFDMIIKNARHFKRKRKMKIPLQYRKIEDYIDNIDVLIYSIFTYSNKDGYSIGRRKRIVEGNTKDLKIIRNRIKHQTRCTFERVYKLMHFEDEV